MKFQRAQSMVEFALVLPLFMLVLFGIIYFGMAFSDYIALNSFARSSAREASISTESEPYNDIKVKYSQKDLPANLYEWDQKDFTIKDITITNDGKSSKNVQVTIDANLSTDKDSLAQIFRNILGEDSLFDIHIQYTMYKEPSSSS
ncbi:TadE family protein [Mitsuokella jalaludinii]|uniref:TadE family protein n=1 Tax=Mitsuokella jalaludinii TaxID=187979 RepID=UPI00298D09F9|nr:TadE/TadG family type IV pilus assembly protein [Mitsuokella jalaludinii]